MTDISTRSDIDVLVRRFYDKLTTDPVIKHIFAPLDLEEHIPRVVHFWSFVLLDEEGYKTNVFEKHMHLPMKQEHFDIWLNHFITTVDQLFKGEIAETAKSRATSLTFTFKNKWQSLGRG